MESSPNLARRLIDLNEITVAWLHKNASWMDGNTFSVANTGVEFDVYWENTAERRGYRIEMTMPFCLHSGEVVNLKHVWFEPHPKDEPPRT